MLFLFHPPVIRFFNPSYYALGFQNKLSSTFIFNAKKGIFRQKVFIQLAHTLLCESAVLVKGKSFVILYTYFSFKHLMENPLAKEFSLLLKGKCFRD